MPPTLEDAYGSADELLADSIESLSRHVLAVAETSVAADGTFRLPDLVTVLRGQGMEAHGCDLFDGARRGEVLAAIDSAIHELIHRQCRMLPAYTSGGGSAFRLI